MSLVSKPGRVCVGPLCPLFSRSMAYTLEHWTQNTLCLLGHLPAWRLWNCQNTKCFLSFDCETELHFGSMSSLMLFWGRTTHPPLTKRYLLPLQGRTPHLSLPKRYPLPLQMLEKQ